MKKILLLIVLGTIFITSMFSMGYVLIVNSENLYLTRDKLTYTLSYEKTKYEYYDYNLNEIDHIEYINNQETSKYMEVAVYDGTAENKISIRSNQEPIKTGSNLEINVKDPIGRSYVNMEIYTKLDLGLGKPTHLWLDTTDINILLQAIKNNDKELLATSFGYSNYKDMMDGFNYMDDFGNMMNIQVMDNLIVKEGE